MNCQEWLMFFFLSKLLAVLLEPLIIPYICLGLALVARWRRRRVLMRLLIGTGLSLPLIYGILPLSSLPLQFLENRISRGDTTMRQIDGIIVLGGFTGDGVIAESRNSYGLGASAERFTAAQELSQKYPDKPVLFSGFSGRLIPKGWAETQQIRDLVSRVGGLGPSVLYEEESRNTYENALYSLKILAATPGNNWILITSAAHMPRALGSFAAVGWTGIIPYPVDYQTSETTPQNRWNISVGIALIRTALHEYVGLAFYYLSGRSTSLLPR